MLVGNTAAGWAWVSYGSAAPFLIGAALSLLAILVIALGPGRQTP